MVLNDRVYGKFKIKESVLVELLKAPSILRLKNISQYGIPDKYYCFKNFSRYEHCVGVMLLLRKLGATLEEQVAGLIHDISVLAFSHVTDWIFGDGPGRVESYHDSIHEMFVVKKTKIPSIFKKHGFVLERLLNEINFPLLEKPKPNLCADRVDYALREIEHRLNKKALAEKLANDLANYNGEIVFNNKNSALKFASIFFDLQTYNWGSNDVVTRYHLFSEILKIALREKVISKKDFYGIEKPIIQKIERSKNKKIQEMLSFLKKKNLQDPKRNSSKKVYKKFRYVDPKLILNGKIVKLSKISSEFRKLFDKHKKINEKGIGV